MKSQQSTDNGQQSSSTSLAFGLLSLVLLFLFPLRSSAQREIDLEVSIPEKWQIDTIYLTNDITDYDWWTRFEDPTLDSLVTTALSNNYNLQSIDATLEKSR